MARDRDGNDPRQAAREASARTDEATRQRLLDIDARVTAAEAGTERRTEGTPATRQSGRMLTGYLSTSNPSCWWIERRI
jgi:hypothetical protein